MMSSVFYGEIKEDKLQTWFDNRDPYDIYHGRLTLVTRKNPKKVGRPRNPHKIRIS